MAFYTSFRRPVPLAHHDSGEVITVTDGYIPLKDQIENFRRNGEILGAYREAQYMYHDNSLAERDTGMPDDIFIEKLDLSQKVKDYQSYMEEKTAENAKEKDPVASELESAAKVPEPEPSGSSETIVSQ